MRQFSAFSSHFQVTSGQITSLQAHFRSPEITWRHFLSRLPPPASYSLVRSETHYTPLFGFVQILPGDFRSNHVTSAHLRWRDIISCHVTAFSYELLPCRKANTQHTPVFGLLQPLPGDFRSNNVTSGSLTVTWGHVTSFPATWLSPASYSLVASRMHSIRQFPAFYSHFQVTSGQMTSLPVTWGHVTSFPVTWLPPPAS